MNTFEITIQRKVGQNWPLVIRHIPGEHALALWSRGTLEIDPQKLGTYSPTNREFGQNLGKALFRDDIRDAFVRAVSDAKSAGEALRVLLFVEAEDLRTLHWEQLHAPLDRGWDYLLLNQATPFSLYLPSQIERRFPPIGRRDLRALILVAGVEEIDGDWGLDHFDTTATVASIRAALGEIPSDVLAVTPDALAPPSLETLSEHLVGGKYTLLHIVAHGAYSAKRDETALYFPKAGRRGPVTSSELIEHLSRMERLPQFTYLSTCESADPQAESGLGGLAQRLVRELGMPAVLAMTDKVTIPTAQALASSFYTRLREHGEVDRALSEALGTLQGQYDVTVPALFSRLGGRALFSDTLDRPLTDAEIRFGLDQLPALVKERAPVLTIESETLSANVNSYLGADTDSLSDEARREHELNLNTLNQLCTEVLDMSFNALALGQYPPDYHERCPFPGLMAFLPEDSDYFFGREALVENLQRRLKEHNFLAVLGPSGSGKSSLVLAGLVPALDLPWAYLTPGSDPSAALNIVKEEHRLIVIDQFEELFTLTTNETIRQDFITRLLELSQSRKVVITMRADFWGEVARYNLLKNEMQAHQELVAPMNADELHQAIDRQAEKVGLRFEADLGQDILEDVQGEPGAMPLLQHALLLLWERRHGRWLRLDEYRAIGGMQKAIAGTADSLYENLTPIEQERVRDIFMRLTRLGDEPSHDEIRDTRRRVTIQELVPAGQNSEEVIALVSKLADARLVVTSEAPGTKLQVVEVTHEALIRHWPRLRTWLDEDRSSLRLRETVRQAAFDWDLHQHDESLLIHRGGRLEDARQLSQSPRFAFNKLEQDYLDACLAFVERERQVKERRRRITLAISLVVAVVTSALAIFGFIQSRLANDRAILAHSGQLAAQSQALVEDAPPRSLLLAVEAINTTTKAGMPTITDAQESLRAALADPHGIPLSGHEGPIEILAVSPDSHWLATGSEDETVKIWDLQAANPLDKTLTVSSEVGEIKALAFSPDGQWLAAAGGDRTAQLWHVNNLADSSILLDGHDSAITTLAFSSDGKWLATGSVDQTVRLWGLTSAGPSANPSVLDGPTGELTAVAFSPDGKWLAAGSIDQNVYLWEVRNPQSEPRILKGHGLMVTTLDFSPDTHWLATGSKDQAILLWDLGDLDTAPITLEGHSDWINSLTFSPDGKWLASGSGDKSARLWDVSSADPTANPIVLRGHTSFINILAFSPDGHWLATGSADKTTHLWDMQASDPSANEGVLRGHEDQVRALAFSSDGLWLATGSLDYTARLWHMRPTNPAESPDVLRGHTDQVDSLAISPDGKWLASGGGNNPTLESKDNNIRLWELDTPDPSAQVRILSGHQDSIPIVAFDPSGKWLASGSTDKTIRLWNVNAANPANNAIILSGHEKSVNVLAFSPDTLSGTGSRWLASGSVDNTVRLWDLTSTNPSTNARILDGHEDYIAAVIFSQDGHWLATASGDSAHLWDVTDPHAAPIPLSGHDGNITSLAFSPSGEWLATGGRDMTIRLWNVADLSAAPIVLKGGHKDWVTTLAFSPDGQWLASGSRDASAQLWNMEKPESSPVTLLGHADTVNSLAFSHSGAWLATGSDDYTARLWDLTSSNPAENSVSLRAHTGSISTLAFSPDDRWLVTGSADQTLHRWLLPLDELIACACLSAGRILTVDEWKQYVPNTEYRSTCP